MTVTDAVVEESGFIYLNIILFIIFGRFGLEGLRSFDGLHIFRENKSFLVDLRMGGMSEEKTIESKKSDE